MGIMVETREGVKQPSRKTCAYASRNSRNSRNARNSKPPESPFTFLFEDFRQKLDHLLPRPDSSNLHHPPPSPANGGTAETREIFRAFCGVLPGFCRSRWHQRRARRAERASFLGFVSNRDFRVPRLRPVGERALTGPCSVGKEATRGVQNRGQGYRGVAG